MREVSRSFEPTNMPASLVIRERLAEGVTILDLEGRITIGSGSEAVNSKLEELIRNGQQRILLNLTNVTQIDSSGIKVVVRNFVSLQKQNGALKLLNPTKHVHEVLKITNLLKVIESFPEEKAALASFA